MRKPSSSRAFTLIELVIVISMLGLVYSLAAPNLTSKSAVEAISRLGRFAGDIRSAFDLAVLTGKPHRMAIRLHDSKYWLEYTDNPHVYIGDKNTSVEVSREEEEQRKEEFDANFERYRELFDEPVKSLESDKDIPNVSPVLNAYEALRGPEWKVVDSLEWRPRQLGEVIGFSSVQTEHHQTPVSVEENGLEAFAYVYFLPKGYVERAVFYLYYMKDEKTFDLEQEPYSVITLPYRGEARVESGLEEVALEETNEKEEY